MTANPRDKKGTCNRCGSCCATYPCALAPDDLGQIAAFFGMSSAEVFRRYLVLDYTAASGRKLYYLCPARLNDRAGKVVDWDWAFDSSPCIFLRGDGCAIEPVKPRGGRTFSCHLVTSTRRNRVIFGKRNAAEAWTGNPVLEQMLCLAKTPVDYGCFTFLNCC